MTTMALGQQRSKSLVNRTINHLNAVKIKLAMMWTTLSMFFVLGLMPTQAQSVSISLDPSDLDVFFQWFNTMFNAILPIALIGAGLVAGAAFAFVVGTMLKKAFQSLTGGNGG